MGFLDDMFGGSSQHYDRYVRQMRGILAPLQGLLLTSVVSTQVLDGNCKISTVTLHKMRLTASWECLVMWRWSVTISYEN